MTRHALLAITLMIASTTAPATATGQAKKPALHERTATVVLPDAVSWGPAPPVLPTGAKAAMLEGDPAKKGPFTLRLSFPDNYQLAPHFHTAPEHVTVLKGKLKVGMGDKFDESQMQTLPSGSFGLIPTGMRHYAKADGETVIQLHGMGPWKLIYVNKADDPRSKVATK